MCKMTNWSGVAALRRWRRTSIAADIWRFSTTRMLHEYTEQLYLPAAGVPPSKLALDAAAEAGDTAAMESAGAIGGATTPGDGPGAIEETEEPASA